MKTASRFLASTALALLATHCGEAAEAPRRTLPLVFAGITDPSVETNLGYAVRVERLRLVVRNFEFALAGEAHARAFEALPHWLVPVAKAHPGHYQGGEVTGEWTGRSALEWAGGEVPLGRATLLLGDYRSANFTFDSAKSGDFDGDETFVGKTARLEGLADRGEFSRRFIVELVAPTDRQLVGAPFVATMDEKSPAELVLEVLLRDPEEGDTLFDDVDFEALAAPDGPLTLSEESEDPAEATAAQLVRRAFLTHDHYRVVGRARP